MRVQPDGRQVLIEGNANTLSVGGVQAPLLHKLGGDAPINEHVEKNVDGGVGGVPTHQCPVLRATGTEAERSVMHISQLQKTGQVLLEQGSIECDVHEGRQAGMALPGTAAAVKLFTFFMENSCA